MRPRLAIVPSLLAALALTACGNEPAAEGELTWEDSPLYRALAEVYGSDQNPEEFEQEEAERMRQVEEITAACMAEEGFEYTPVSHDQGVTYYTEDDGWGTAEWAAQYGYGITTDPWADEEPMVPEEEWTDPNADYVESMSPSEQEAYYAALYGEPQFTEDDGEWVEGDEYIEEEYHWEEAGCQGRAHHEVYEGEDGGMMWEDPAFAEFFEASERLYEDALRDPRVAEIHSEWAQCMADAGISGMTSPDEAANSLYEEYDKLWMEADEQVDWEGIDWENVEPDFDPVKEYMDSTGLAELREREIATAVADLECQEELDTQSRYLEIQFELEEEFVTTYQADIDAIIAAYGQDS